MHLRHQTSPVIPVSEACILYRYLTCDYGPVGFMDTKPLRRGSVITSPEKNEKMTLLSYNKSKIGTRDKILCAHRDSLVVLSVFDSHSLGGDTCLGQVAGKNISLYLFAVVIHIVSRLSSSYRSV